MRVIVSDIPQIHWTVLPATVIAVVGLPVLISKEQRKKGHVPYALPALLEILNSRIGPYGIVLQRCEKEGSPRRG